MTNMAELPYRYLFDVRFSLIADVGLCVRFVLEADISYIGLH